MGLFLAFVIGYLANHLYVLSLGKLDTGVAAILTTGTPFVAALTGALVFQEQINGNQIIGMIMIVCAVVLLNLKPKNPPKEYGEIGGEVEQ